MDWRLNDLHKQLLAVTCGFWIAIIFVGYFIGYLDSIGEWFFIILVWAGVLGWTYYRHGGKDDGIGSETC